MENSLDQIEKLLPWLEELRKEFQLDQTDMFRINVALDETMSNVIAYAWPHEDNKVFTLEAIKVDGGADFILTDTGVEFNPLEVKDPDITLQAENRQIGGLGIYMTKQMMEHISYMRKDGKNILTMKYRSDR